MMDWSELFSKMENHGMPLPVVKRFSVENPADTFVGAYSAMLARLGRTYQPQPEYDAVVEWLGDTQGKGLLLHGTCGRGKSFIARYVLPAIFMQYGKVLNVFDATEIKDVATLERIKKLRLVVLDDIGTEAEINDYGTKVQAFTELVDNAEKVGNMLVVTSNLNAEQLAKMYGERTIERLRAITKRVVFTGKSLR